MKGAAEAGASCPRTDDQELGRNAVSPLTEKMDVFLKVGRMIFQAQR